MCNKLVFLLRLSGETSNSDLAGKLSLLVDEPRLLQGDSLRNWRNEPFVMVEGGPRWIPPSMTAMTHGKEQTAAQRGGEAKEKDKPLSDLQRDR